MTNASVVTEGATDAGNARTNRKPPDGSVLDELTAEAQAIKSAIAQRERRQPDGKASHW